MILNKSDVEKWNREVKLFAIEGLSQIEAPRGEELLLNLITDDDPVVRGKTALALESASDKLIERAVDRLCAKQPTEMTILGLELLAMTDDLDYSDRLSSMLNNSDPRVIKSVIDSLTNLAHGQVKLVLNKILQQYKPKYHKALTRLFVEKNDPNLFSQAKRWYELSDSDEHKLTILRHVAALPSEQAKQWTQNQIGDQPGDKTDIIRWLCSNN